MNSSDLFYTCSLIEFIGRKTKNTRAAVVSYLGKDNISRIYRYADVFHSDIIEKVADEFIEKCHIATGEFDNVGKCKYTVPDYWDIGEVFERLIEDTYDGQSDLIDFIIEIYNSWLTEAISNFNSDLYYQPRDYIRECYKEGKICA